MADVGKIYAGGGGGAAEKSAVMKRKKLSQPSPFFHGPFGTAWRMEEIQDFPGVFPTRDPENPTKRAGILSRILQRGGERKCLCCGRDTLVQKVLQILAVTGEFPWSSLYLLGNPPTVQKMVSRLSQPVLFRNPLHRGRGENKAFRPHREGPGKSLRLYKGALPLLHWLHPGAYEYYMDSFWNHHFPGDAAHRDRNHRVAEAVALCANAGVKVLPYDLPKLQQEEIRKVTPKSPTRLPGPGHQESGFPVRRKRPLFTRAVGALFYPRRMLCCVQHPGRRHEVERHGGVQSPPQPDRSGTAQRRGNPFGRGAALWQVL